MIFKSTSDVLRVGTQMVSTSAISDQLDFNSFFRDLTDHNYIYNKALVEKAFLNASRASQLYGTQILEPGISKPGSVASWNSDTKTFMENPFKRESKAFYLDYNAEFKEAEENMPRVEYDVFSRKCKGILIEPLGINRIQYSHGSINDPKSLKLGFEIEDSKSPFENILLKRSGTVTTSIKHLSLLLPETIFTYYAIIKIEDGRKLFPEDFKLIINGQDETPIIEFISYGYYYLTCTFTVSNVVSNQIELKTLESLKDLNVRIYGEQLEESLQRTSYIKTEGQIGIRNADEFTIASTFNCKNMSISLDIHDSSKAAATLTNSWTTTSFYKDGFVVGVGDMKYKDSKAFFLYKGLNLYINGEVPQEIPFTKTADSPTLTFNVPTEGKYYIKELVTYSNRVDENTYTKIFD